MVREPFNVLLLSPFVFPNMAERRKIIERARPAHEAAGIWGGNSHYNPPVLDFR